MDSAYTVESIRKVEAGNHVVYLAKLELEGAIMSIT